MGKKSGTSWLTAVKRAFRSPTKDQSDKQRNCRRKEDHDHDHDTEEDDKKKERRRWLFRKTATNQEQSPLKEVNAAGVDASGAATSDASGAADQRHAIAVAVATAAAAEAAVATAQAAMEVARLTRHPQGQPMPLSVPSSREHYAAIVIQTAFRGYLARRALTALKGLVKLQALVRGHNVRKQAKMTLKCMQALVRVQARVLDQRMRMSHEGSRKSAFSDTTSLFESRYLQDIAERRSISHSREPSSIADDWDDRPHTIEEVKAMLQNRKEAALKREKSLSQALSQQMWRSDRSSSGGEDELEEKPRWLDRWMASKQWKTATATAVAAVNNVTTRARASTDHRDPIKTVEIDTSQPYSYLANYNNFRRSSTSNPHQPSYQRPSSPLHSHAYHQQQPPPTTPSPAKTRPIQVRSASPRCIRETSQTPSLRSNYHYTGHLHPHYTTRGTPSSSNISMPNYMAATESAKARFRSQSAPRQRPSTPERDRAGSVAKKRLSFPAPDPFSAGGYGYGYSLRSPSFKSTVSGVMHNIGMVEQQSNYSSCYTDSLGGEISPSSTSDLRRWLR